MLKITTISTLAVLLATPAFAQQDSTQAPTDSRATSQYQYMEQQAAANPYAAPPVVSQVPANNGVTILSCGLLTPCHDGATGA